MLIKIYYMLIFIYLKNLIQCMYIHDTNRLENLKISYCDYMVSDFEDVTWISSNPVAEDEFFLSHLPE